MWPVIWTFVRTNAPYITLPAAAVIGFIGYNVEWLIRKEKNTPYRVNSTQEDRLERKLKEIDEADLTDVPSLKLKNELPKAILGRNDSQSES